MIIKKTTSHEVTFTIEAFWNEEGGMGQDQFGGKVHDLAAAVHLLELARAQDTKTKWVIVGDVKSSVTGS